MIDHASNRVTLRFLAEPSDVNFGGKVHGDEAIHVSVELLCKKYID